MFLFTGPKKSCLFLREILSSRCQFPSTLYVINGIPPSLSLPNSRRPLKVGPSVGLSLGLDSAAPASSTFDHLLLQQQQLLLCPLSTPLTEAFDARTRDKFVTNGHTDDRKQTQTGKFIWCFFSPLFSFSLTLTRLSASSPLSPPWQPPTRVSGWTSARDFELSQTLSSCM